MKAFSKLSMAEWNRLREQAMSPEEAVRYLYEGLPCRSFAETLARLHPAGDLRALLTEALREGGASAESADRTARNWLGGASEPRDRDTLYRVAFKLGLDVEGANTLLCSASDYGIHARDPREVVYLFALRTRRGFDEAQRLLKTCETMRGSGAGEAAATRLLGEQVAQLESDAEFLAWYEQHIDDFSQQHATARAAFLEYLAYLTNGESEDFSLEYIASTCLRFQDAVPLDRSRARLDSMQKIIKRFWPNVTAVKQMKDGRIDVSRKALLLLYILCEGATSDDEYSELDEDYLSPAEQMEARVLSVDSLLETCGMGLLDPRGAFDWLMLYCLRMDEDDGMSERMERVMARLFRVETESTAE